MQNKTHFPYDSSPGAPFPFGLRYISRHLPHGMNGMMQLAWLSKDIRARSVAHVWKVADKASQESMDVEAVCEYARISSAAFVGAVVSVAYELQVDVSGMIGGIVRMPDLLQAAFQQAFRTGQGLSEACDVIEQIGRTMQHRR